MNKCRHFNLLRKTLNLHSTKFRRQYYCLDCGWKLVHTKCGGFKLLRKTKLRKMDLINIGYRYVRKDRCVSKWEKTFSETWDLIGIFEEHERVAWGSKNQLLTDARECARMQAYVELAEKLADAAWKPCKRDYVDNGKLLYKSCTCSPNSTFAKCWHKHVKERIRKEQVSAPDKSKRISN